MADITAAMVMKLRDETGQPMMDCKKALQESNGDPEKAKQTLREKGIKIMSIRSDRPTEEGRIAVYTSLNPGVGAMIELQVESAPVAKHEEIVGLANDLAKQLATGPGAKTPDDLWGQPAPSKPGKTLRDWKDEIEGKMREVLRLARVHRINTPTGGYVHHDGKSGVLLEVEGGNDELAKGIAMAKQLTRASASFTWANSAAKRLNCSLSCDSVVVSRLQIWSRRSGVLSPSARR